MAHQVDGFYGSDGILRLAYLATEIGRTTQVVELEGVQTTMTNLPTEEQTDIRLLEHSLVVDLAVDDEDLYLNPQVPKEGDAVSATLSVHNAGDFATDGFLVDLYVGDPGARGTLVDTATVTGPFPGGGSVDLAFSFNYSAGGGNIVAVVDSGNQVTEITEANNTASWYLDNRAPVAKVVASLTSGAAPLTVDFEASLSYDPDGDAVSYSWAFADGSDSEAGEAVSHTFAEVGTFPVTVAVTDEHGAVGTVVVVISVARTDIFADTFESGDTTAWSSTTGAQ